jgi:hypothetical protein
VPVYRSGKRDHGTEPEPDLSQPAESWRHGVNREASSDEQGTERKVSMRFGSQLDARLLHAAFASATRFAGRSNVEAHCLALEKSPPDGSYPVRNSH